MHISNHTPSTIMIARLWRTRIDPVRSEDYDAYVVRYSRPMFSSLPGCMGAFFLGDGEDRAALTLWADEASIKAAEKSAIYAETVARYESIFRPPQTIELFAVTGATIDTLALSATVSPRLNPHDDA